MERSVTSAPLCGTGSIPTEAMETMRCKTSGGIFCAIAISNQSLPKRFSAIVIPPDAEPVIAPITFVVTVALT